MVIFTMSVTTLGRDERYAALCGLWQDNNHRYVRGHKNKKSSFTLVLKKVTSTKYFMESTWYLTISRWGRNRTNE